MEEKFIAVVYKSKDSREYDKILDLITPLGVKKATMRGVKRPTAKLRFAALAFAFCEYTAIKKGNSLIITGAQQIEDLFLVASDEERLTAASIVLEAAFSALKEQCAPQFVFMLKRIKEIIYEKKPYLSAIRFLQYLIHDAGYGYDYPPPPVNIISVMDLLSALYFLQPDDAAEITAGDELIKKTLFKIIANFENKFETEILAKKLIA